jgi:NadR type nicotinamide-nucleotide adenylyltransferase
MPLKKRYRYVREFFADDDLVAVYPIDETELGIEAYPNGWDKFMDKVEEIIERATYLCEAVFYVSEEEYATHLNSLGYEVVKLDRTLNPISATMIRQNPIKYWDKITFPVRRVFSTNILICGTAGTTSGAKGKTPASGFGGGGCGATYIFLNYITGGAGRQGTVRIYY